MPSRYAIYFAPARDSELWRRGEDWLAQPDLENLTVSARRYGFHATLKAPMALAGEPDEFDAAVSEFVLDAAPVVLTGLAPRLLDGFLALTTEPQPQALTELAAEVVRALEPFRAPLTPAERAKRLSAPLTPRQIELVDAYGYPYVLEQFLFHMTLTDRLPAERRDELLSLARNWFAGALAAPVVLDRLALFAEPEPGAAFRRLGDYALMGAR